MKATQVVGTIVAGIVLAIVAFVILLLPIKLMWAWTVPGLFPGAVEQGLVAAKISWFTAAKLSILIAVIAGIAGGRSRCGID